MSLLAPQHTWGSCVCVQSESELSTPLCGEKAESQDGSVCEDAHTHKLTKVVNYTTTETLHFASTTTNIVIESASRVLVLSGVVA